jgi:hypothetical protein
MDAIATNATIATVIQDVSANYLPAVKANQPTERGEVEACFATACPARLRSTSTTTKAIDALSTAPQG